MPLTLNTLHHFRSTSPALILKTFNLKTLYMPYQSFEDLETWKRGCQLAVEIYQLFENSRDFAYKNQMIRSSLSIPSNIAEGAERMSDKEFIRFLHISKGSCAELRTQLYLCSKLNIISIEKAVLSSTKPKKSAKCSTA